jgi:hypothetical protein
VGLVEAPSGGGGQVDDGGQAGLQPAAPWTRLALVLVPHDQWAEPAVTGRPAADQQAAAGPARRGQAAQEA